MTPALANSYGWHVNWAAINGTVQAVKKYYDAGGTRIAMRDNGQLRWLLGDHLGSTSYTANGATEQGEVRYKPFGVTRYTSGTTPTTYRYTGQREEASLGLYYYGARWYDPALGRFIQPDTVVPDPGDAKAFDRYAYVNNNPLRYSDPSGHAPCSSPWGLVICSLWQSFVQSDENLKEAAHDNLLPKHDAVGVYIPSPTKAVGLPFQLEGGGTGGFEVIRNDHTGVVTAFGVIGGGVGGGTGAVIKPFQVTFINQIDEDNLGYKGSFVSVDVTGAADGVGLTLGYAYTLRQEFKGWNVWEYLARKDEASYSFIVGPASGEGVNVSGNYVLYTPLFDYVDGKIIPHHGQLTQEQIDYLLPIVEQGVSILDEQ